jgi:hypothetical protein
MRGFIFPKVEWNSLVVVILTAVFTGPRSEGPINAAVEVDTPWMARLGDVIPPDKIFACTRLFGFFMTSPTTLWEGGRGAGRGGRRAMTHSLSSGPHLSLLLLVQLSEKESDHGRLEISSFEDEE